MNKQLLVIVAHPDDEVLGCGGTIARLSKQGFDLHIVFLADGINSRHSIAVDTSFELNARRNAARIAAEILGVKTVIFGNFPDNRMDTVAFLDIVQFVERQVNQFMPEMILTHHAGDLNIDHRLVHQATITACRPQPQYCVKTLLFFEVPSSTEWQTPSSAVGFSPNWFVDISSYLYTKNQALEAYIHEMRPWPHSRSIQAVEYLARWRGASVGVEAAEAFMLGRQLNIDK